MSKKFILYICIFLIAGTVGCYLRLYPLRNYVSSDAHDKASIIVMKNAASSIQQNLRNANPSLSPAQQQQLAIKQLNTAIGKNREKAKQTIFEVAKKIDKKNPPKQKSPYLLASDSYYYYDLTKTLKETGRFSPNIKGSKYFHPKMTAPDGYWEPLNLHAYVGLAVHSVFSLFNSNIDLMFTVSFVPLFLMLFALICFLIIMRNLSLSPWAALIASIYLVCIQIFLKRSAFGWYDNDPYNVLFPMMLMMILSYAFNTKILHKKIIYGTILAVGLCLYSLFWQGWVFVASVLTGSLIIVAIYDHILHDFSDEKDTYITLGIFLIGSLIGISLIFGIKEIFILFQEGWQALLGFFNAKISIWPDTYIAVGELKKSTLPMIINLTGGIFFFIISLVGFLSGLYHHIWKKSHPSHHRLWITATLFTIASIAISLGAQRFTLLSVAPLTILFAFGLNEIINSIQMLTRKLTSKNTSFIFPAIIIFLSCACIIPKVITSEQHMPKLLNRLYNDTWNKSLTYINKNTPKNAIINSWWPPGHFIKAIADRRVTIDGATINNRQSYWLANALLAQDEKKALDYFRLLNNSGNQAIDLLLKSGMKDSEAVAFLKHIIHQPRHKAQTQAAQLLGKKSDQLIALTHGETDPSYLLIYNEMIQNILLYPFVSRWDFKKVEHLNDNPDIWKKALSSGTTKEYVNFLWSIVGGQPKISDILSAKNQQGSLIVFSEGLIYDSAQKNCRIKSSTYGQGIPEFLIYQDGTNVIKKPLPNSNLSYSIIIGKRYGKYKAMLIETPLAESLLIRLYFFGDTGLKHIKLIHQDASLTRQTQIDTFEIKTN